MVDDQRIEERYCLVCGWVDYGADLAEARRAAATDFVSTKSRMRRPMMNGMVL